MRLIQASANAIPLPDESVQTCVTSPPYWGLRQYAGEQQQVWGGDADHAHEWGAERFVATGNAPSAKSTLTTNNGRGPLPGDKYEASNAGTASTGAFCPCGAWYGALGLEPTPDLYVEHMVEVFREVKRVLRPDGTLWMNLGDSYAGNRGNTTDKPGFDNKSAGVVGADLAIGISKLAPGYKPKDLVGIPWMVAFALRADGWYLRSDIIWHKPNPMPESVTDRPTKSHEYMFLLSKSERYFYDAEAIKEPAIYAGTVVKASDPDTAKNGQKGEYGATALGFTQHDTVVGAGRNKRTVWTIATRPYAGAHFATYPEDLVEPCILAGSSPKACGVCGAPWERVTERERLPGSERPMTTGAAKRAELGDMARTTPVGRTAGSVSVETTGWQPTCAHNDDSGICTILDPFNGSGTTGVVAVRHNREYIGVDISDEYMELARQRINEVQRVLF